MNPQREDNCVKDEQAPLNFTLDHMLFKKGILINFFLDIRELSNKTITFQYSIALYI